MGISEWAYAPYLPKNSPESHHFSKVAAKSLRRTDLVVRCTAIKYTACRKSVCAVKKFVECYSVCPMTKPEALLIPAANPECGSEGRKRCEGPFHQNGTLIAGKSYGALACHQIAMMF